MRPRVTLQLPKTHEPAVSVRGASVLLIGHGYVAQRLGPRLSDRGATVRHTVRDGFLSLGSPVMRSAFASADIVLVSVPPGRDGTDPVLDALNGLPTRARWIGYLSATSVYGDRGGQWAFEGEAPTPTLERGRRRADAESAWLQAYAQTQIFRLAGIYGPGRAPFSKIREGSARIVNAPGHLVNRIHVDDIASALMASIARPSPQDILNLADGRPAAPGEVMAYAAGLIWEPTPPLVRLSDPSVSDMARSFYAESKRIDISRARTRLGWEPKYPSFKPGLKAVLAAENIAARALAM